MGTATIFDEKRGQPPSRYVAFLRAINVGGHVVKMADLRKHFELLRFANVETFIASGNVVFDTAAAPDRALEEQIEAHLHKRLGYRVDTFVRSIPELQAIADYQPFKNAGFDADGARRYVGFLSAPPPAATARKLNAFRTDTEALRVRGREFYWIATVPSSESAFTGGALEKLLGMPTTLRNINTVQRVVAKYATHD